MADTIASNLIIKSKLSKPEGTGLDTVKKELSEILELIYKINSQSVKINVDLSGTEEAIASLQNISVIARHNLNKAAREAGRRSTPQPSHPNQGATVGPARGPGTSMVVQGGRNVAVYGQAVSTGNTGTSLVPSRPYNTGIATTGSRSIGNVGGGGGVGSPGAGGLGGVGGQPAAGAGGGGVGRGRGGSPPFFSDFGQPHKIVHRLNPEGAESVSVHGETRQGGFRHENVEHFYTDEHGKMQEGDKVETIHNEAQQRANARAKREEAQAEQEQLDRQRRLADIQQRRQQGEDFTRQRSGSGEEVRPDKVIREGRNDNQASTIRTTAKALQDGSEAVTRYNEAQDRTTEFVNRNTAAYRNNQKILKLQANEALATAHENDVLGQGYRLHSTAVKNFNVGQQQLTSTVKEFRRVSGNPILGNFQIEIAKVNSSSGTLNRNIITGTQAMRAFGDSFSGAIAKVGTWLAATSSVYLLIRGVGAAVNEFKNLEHETIFLARVGQALGTSFQERRSEAALLTIEIASLSAQLGVESDSSQKAAAVFLRAGQNRKQALESVKAAMIASKIAEVDVEEGAKHIAAAQQQFNLESSKSLPIIDSLNTLSNRYVVSTNDLLQAISRGGKVYADANGKIEGLAATVAVVAQRTRRSGAEIGNAIKTIQSRLTTPDISGTLFTKLGVDLYDSSGKAKDFTKVLLQLQSAMSTLSNEERDQIAVTIAGARQVNILKTALDSVDEIATAHAAALRGSGSATAEAMEEANGLASAIARLRGEFTKLTLNLGNSPIGVLLTGLVDAITVVLKLANSFDGLLVKVAAFLVAAELLRFAIVRFMASEMPAIVATRNLGSALLAMGGSANVAAAGLTRTGAAANLMWGALARVGPATILLAAFTAISYVVTEITKAFLDFSNANANAGQAAEEAAQKIDREAEAVRGLAGAISELVQEQRRLIEGRKNAPDFGKEGTQEYKNAQRLARLRSQIENKPVHSPEDFLNQSGLDEISGGAKKAVRSSSDDKINNLESQIKALEDSKEKSQKSLDVYKKLAEGSTKDYGYDMGGGMGGTSLNSTWMKQQKKFQKEVEDATLKLKQLEVEREKAISTGNKEADYTTDNKELVEQYKLLEESIQAWERLHASREKIGHGTMFLENRIIKDNISELERQQAELLKIRDSLKTTNPLWEDIGKKIVKITEELEKQRTNQLQNKIKSFREQYSDLAKVADDIAVGTASQKSKLNFIRTEGEGQGGNKFEQYEALKAETEATKQLAFARAKALQAKAAELVPNNAKKLGEIQAEELQIQELLKRAKEGELKAVEELLKLERDVTSERIKQNKEAAKAAGLLTDENKIRLLGIAAELRKNPNRKFSRSDMFMMQQNTAEDINKYYPGSIDHNPNSPGNKRFNDTFGPDFGVDQDTQKAEKGLKDKGLLQGDQASGRKPGSINLGNPILAQYYGRGDTNAFPTANPFQPNTPEGGAGDPVGQAQGYAAYDKQEADAKAAKAKRDKGDSDALSSQNELIAKHNELEDSRSAAAYTKSEQSKSYIRGWDAKQDKARADRREYNSEYYKAKRSGAEWSVNHPGSKEPDQQYGGASYGTGEFPKSGGVSTGTGGFPKPDGTQPVVSSGNTASNSVAGGKTYSTHGGTGRREALARGRRGRGGRVGGYGYQQSSYDSNQSKRIAGIKARQKRQADLADTRRRKRKEGLESQLPPEEYLALHPELQYGGTSPGTGGFGDEGPTTSETMPAGQSGSGPQSTAPAVSQPTSPGPATGGPNAIEQHKKNAEDLIGVQAGMAGNQQVHPQAPMDVNVNNPISADAFQPMVKAFENAVATQVMGLRDELVADIERIWLVVEKNGLHRRTGLVPVSPQ